MYTVIFPTGRVMQFYVKSVAQLYAQNGRGTLVDLQESALESIKNNPKLLEVIQRMACR
jgi:hypothetical protein